MKRAILTSMMLAAGLFAQQPRVANAKLETKAAGSLEGEIQAAASRGTAMWVGYAFEQIADSNSCCYSGDGGGGCTLEGDKTWKGQPEGPIQLEGSKFGMVLVRLEGGAIKKVRHFSLTCDLEAGGLPFLWLTGVKASESLQFLKKQAVTEGRENAAVAAIAMHSGPGADQVLEEFLKPDQPVELRRKTVFWLGNSRGHQGVEVLKRVMRDDPSEKVREHAVFALSQSKDPEGMQVVIRTAKEDKSADVRSKALFWLAQRAGQKAVGPISSAIAEDPDTKVKKQAVFALTQMPKEEGIPALIKVARENKNPEVRKQAFFWLGQSKDPRAASFLEEVLGK